MARIIITTSRILQQLRHDHRTLGLVFFMPTVFLTILYFVFEDNSVLFDAIAPLLLGVIPFFLMFIVSSVAVLRERNSGTLERLLTLPISKVEIILGYAIAFALFALIQATLASLVTITVLGVDITGSTLSLVSIAVLAGIQGMAFGLFFSAFAKNEFQAVQFMPAFVLPQLLTCGLFVPRDTMTESLQYFANIMPMTYIIDALNQVKDVPGWSTELSTYAFITVAFTILALVLGVVSLRAR